MCCCCCFAMLAADAQDAASILIAVMITSLSPLLACSFTLSLSLSTAPGPLMYDTRRLASLVHQEKGKRKGGHTNLQELYRRRGVVGDVRQPASGDGAAAAATTTTTTAAAAAASEGEDGTQASERVSKTGESLARLEWQRRRRRQQERGNRREREERQRKRRQTTRGREKGSSSSSRRRRRRSSCSPLASAHNAARDPAASLAFRSLAHSPPAQDLPDAAVDSRLSAPAPAVLLLRSRRTRRRRPSPSPVCHTHTLSLSLSRQPSLSCMHPLTHSLSLLQTIMIRT